MRWADGFWCVGVLPPDAVHDGDTLRLSLPEAVLSESPLGDLRVRLRRDQQGAWPIRLAGVDAPELDYPGALPAMRHQPLHAALAAREWLLQAAVRAQTGGGLRLWVSGVDRYGRLIACLWPRRGDDTLRDKNTWAGEPKLPDSLNAGLLRDGMAYPDFHEDLPMAALAELRHITQIAIQQRLGVWSEDVTHQAIALDTLHLLSESRLIWPRLWRRLAECARQSLLMNTEADRNHARVAPAITGWQLRDFLIARGGMARNFTGGPWKNLADHLEMAGQHCRFPDAVENLLHRSPPDRKKLT